MLKITKTRQWLFLPMSAIFYLLVWLRRKCYQLGLKTSVHFAVPIIIIGNISVGGSGKTPLCIAIIQYFQKKGRRVGVVSYGYGGRNKGGNLVLKHDSPAQLSGDEPSLIKQQTDAIVVVNKNRSAAVKKAISLGAELIISDDGLQHYQMGRDVEVAVVDNIYGFGNGYLLPSGILREPIWRLDSVDMVVFHKRAGAKETLKLAKFIDKPYYEMKLVPICLVNVKTKQTVAIADFLIRHQLVYAIAAIATPKSFFSQLEQLGFSLFAKYAYPDHYLFKAADFYNKNKYPILMTGKDCVKCQSFASDNMWYLSVKADLPKHFFKQLDNLL